MMNIQHQAPEFDGAFADGRREQKKRGGAKILNTVVLPPKTQPEPVLYLRHRKGICTKSDLQLEGKTVLITRTRKP